MSEDVVFRDGTRLTGQAAEDYRDAVVKAGRDLAANLQSGLRYMATLQPPWSVYVRRSSMGQVKCNNCVATWDEREAIPLNEVPDLLQRVAPGEEVPFGACPDCKALVYVVEGNGTDTSTRPDFDTSVEDALRRMRSSRDDLQEELTNRAIADAAGLRTELTEARAQVTQIFNEAMEQGREFIRLIPELLAAGRVGAEAPESPSANHVVAALVVRLGTHTPSGRVVLLPRQVLEEVEASRLAVRETSNEFAPESAAGGLVLTYRTT